MIEIKGDGFLLMRSEGIKKLDGMGRREGGERRR